MIVKCIRFYKTDLVSRHLHARGHFGIMPSKTQTIWIPTEPFHGRKGQMQGLMPDRPIMKVFSRRCQPRRMPLMPEVRQSQVWEFPPWPGMEVVLSLRQALLEVGKHCPIKCQLRSMMKLIEDPASNLLAQGPTVAVEKTRAVEGLSCTYLIISPIPSNLKNPR